jgi:hypothetical protein
VFCPKPRVTSIAYETRKGLPQLALKAPSLSLKDLADLCLTHLAQHPEQLAEFMVQSGLDPQSLRGLIGTPSFAHGLIDYVVANEPMLLAIAAKNRLKPEAITAAWARLHRHEA